MNHISGAAKAGVAGVYNRAKYRAEKLDALERWALHVKSLLGSVDISPEPVRATACR